MLATVDYTLALRAVLQDYRAGRACRADICDAHPELLRAARNVGEPALTPCPVCAADALVIVAYAFSPEFKRENGRVWDRHDISGLAKLRDPRLFTVEVCVECHWNHLRSAISITKRPARSREASP